MGFKQAAFSASLLLTFVLLLFSPLANASHNDYILTEIDESDNSFFYVPGSKTATKVAFKTAEFGADVVQGFGQGIWDTATGLWNLGAGVVKGGIEGAKWIGNKAEQTWNDPGKTWGEVKQGTESIKQGVGNFAADPLGNMWDASKATASFTGNMVTGYVDYITDCPTGHVGQCIGKGGFEAASFAFSAGKVGKITKVAKEAEAAAQLQKAAKLEKAAVEAAKLQKLREAEAIAQKTAGQIEKAKFGEEAWAAKKVAEKLAEKEAKLVKEAKKIQATKLAAEKAKTFTDKLTDSWAKFKDEFTRPLKVEPVGHYNPQTFKPFAGPHLEAGPLSAFTKPLGNLLFGNTNAAPGLVGVVVKSVQSALFSHPVNPFTVGAAVKGYEQSKKEQKPTTGAYSLQKPTPKPATTTQQKTTTSTTTTSTNPQKTTVSSSSSSSSSSGLSTLAKTALKTLTAVSPVANAISKAVSSITSFFTAPKPAAAPAAPKVNSAPAPTVRSAPAPSRSAPAVRSAPAPAPSRSAPSAPSRSSSGGSRSSGGGRGGRR